MVYYKLKMAASLDMRSSDEANADLVLKHYAVTNQQFEFVQKIYLVHNTISKLCKHSEGR